MKKILAVVLVSLSTLLASGSVLAQGKPETLVKQRKAAMTLIGKYWGPINAMAKGEKPYNADTVKLNAAYLDALARMPWDGFKANTQGVKSRALPAIYSDSAKFTKFQEGLQDEAHKLASVANGGSQGAVIAQIKAVGKNCGGCHKAFREKKK